MPFDRSTLETREACPLCASAERAGELELDGFHIVRCRGCDFRYVVEVAGEAANAGYYEDGYSGERHRQGQDVYASINIDILRSLPALKGKRLLDIGSGFGFLAARARDELGMEVAGAELSKAEREWAEANLGVATYPSLEAVPADRTFDVITMLEVIEHVRDPLEIIAAAAARLAPGGHLLIGTDNFEARAVKAMGEGFPKWIPNQHISLFGPASLVNAGTRSGVLTLRKTCSYTPWEYWARAAVIRATGGRKGARRFRLADELGSEDSRGYKFFKLRRAANAHHARLSRQNSLDGAMMYAAFQKVS